MTKSGFRLPHPRGIRWLVLLMALAGCDSTRSFDMTHGQPPAYIDQEDPAARDLAAERLSDAVVQGTREHRLEPGDVVQVLYHASHAPTVRDYRLAVGDEIEVAFDRQPDPPHNYVVRPDGRFALPEHGDISAAGKRPADLGREIAARYSDTLVNPSVTVNVRRFTSNSDDFMAMISGGLSPHTETITVAPDGTLTPPMLSSVHAAGHTTDELSSIIDHDYEERLGNISTTIRLSSVASEEVFVFGEVQRPGPIPATRARSVLQLIAAAGGPTEFASMTGVRVLYWDEAGRPRIRQTNLMSVLDKLNLDEDMIVPSNAVVYVPPTQLAKAGRYVDQLLRRTFLYQGASVGLQFGTVGTFK